QKLDFFCLTFWGQFKNRGVKKFILKKPQIMAFIRKNFKATIR
ncbi:hypothetical protein SMU36_05535, partial [Streptococcus mutans 4VF1]